MAQLAQLDVILNIMSNSKRAFRGRCFIGTWNSFPEDYKDKLKAYEKATFQEEIGESGNHHIQFAIKTKNPTTIKAMAADLVGAHIEHAKNWFACEAYCKKSETAVAGTQESTVKTRKPVRDPLEGKSLRPIQSKIMRILGGEPDDRTINWVVDYAGNSGKTCLAKHLCLTNPESTLYVSGKASDIKYGVYTFLQKFELEVLLIDLTRSVEGFVSYQAIEECKNGIFYNTKYESGMCCFNPPHIVVFANFAPETHKLSADRWNILDVAQWHNGTGVLAGTDEDGTEDGDAMFEA